MGQPADGWRGLSKSLGDRTCCQRSVRMVADPEAGQGPQGYRPNDVDDGKLPKRRCILEQQYTV